MRAAYTLCFAASALAQRVHIGGGELPEGFPGLPSVPAVEAEGAGFAGGQGTVVHVPGWLARGDVQYVEIPEVMSTALVFEAEAAPEGCATTFFVAVYACAACTEGADGGLPEQLEGDGWERLAAPAPRFSLYDTDAFEHPTGLYRKHVAPGTPEALHVRGGARHAGVFAAGCGVDLQHPAVALPARAGSPCAAHCPPGSAGFTRY
eukprot:TRINITY_DN29774_c0_g1_i1.p3 TRINITY_DN29774_c0_g1~~TRINITY_DN29774_c0_g1_i1.p3  ORF type:complete len:206 (+),score=27.94 TRINITY_DN29774_c0_g1_i1:47-664(+)